MHQNKFFDVKLKIEIHDIDPDINEETFQATNIELMCSDIIEASQIDDDDLLNDTILRLCNAFQDFKLPQEPILCLEPIFTIFSSILLESSNDDLIINVLTILQILTSIDTTFYSDEIVNNEFINILISSTHHNNSNISKLSFEIIGNICADNESYAQKVYSLFPPNSYLDQQFSSNSWIWILTKMCTYSLPDECCLAIISTIIKSLNSDLINDEHFLLQSFNTLSNFRRNNPKKLYICINEGLLEVFNNLKGDVEPEIISTILAFYGDILMQDIHVKLSVNKIFEYILVDVKEVAENALWLLSLVIEKNMAISGQFDFQQLLGIIIPFIHDGSYSMKKNSFIILSEIIKYSDTQTLNYISLHPLMESFYIIIEQEEEDIDFVVTMIKSLILLCLNCENNFIEHFSTNLRSIIEEKMLLSDELAALSNELFDIINK